MLKQHAHDAAPDISELEQRAEEQLKNVGRHVDGLRQSIRDEFNMRGRVKDNIHERPGASYGAAAGAALIAGYILARILKAEARPRH
jgi:ElaB/YqjD/DUF883 family membrane-anchored ribosome-binding protein